MLRLVFQYRHIVDIDQARELLIACVDTFTSAINADIRIHPYLANYPFKPKNIDIMIVLRNPDGSRGPPGTFILIHAAEGKFQYNIDDPETTRMKTIYEETYEEAVLKIGEKQKTYK